MGIICHCCSFRSDECRRHFCQSELPVPSSPNQRQVQLSIWLGSSYLCVRFLQTLHYPVDQMRRSHARTLTPCARFPRAFVRSCVRCGRKSCYKFRSTILAATAAAAAPLWSAYPLRSTAATTAGNRAPHRTSGTSSKNIISSLTNLCGLLCMRRISIHFARHLHE